MITVNIVADSVNEGGNRITTFLLVYPRFIHAEFLTHRVISRSSASSRAIPVKKMIERVRSNPAMPVYWGSSQPGMQAGKEISNTGYAAATWVYAANQACDIAEKLLEVGLHKQIVNRVLEPFSHITVLATATEWGNFFNLRAHPDAQPEFQELAYNMLDAYAESVPKLLKRGEWHLPFADKYIDEGLSQDQLLQITTARAARVSYLNFDGNIDHQKDYELHDSLANSGHWSPFEHAACSQYYNIPCANLIGFCSYRKYFFERENQREFDIQQIRSNRNKVTT